MKHNLNNKMLEAISSGIQLALDDFDDIENNNTNYSSDIINSSDPIADYQLHLGQKMITFKIFVHELLKRLPNVDKKLFAPFGFVNYKVTGNDRDWPYITSLNRKMADKIRQKYEEIFDRKGWTSISGSYTFQRLLNIEKDRIPNNQYSENGLFGNELLKEILKKEPFWEEKFKDKYEECVNILQRICKSKSLDSNNTQILIYQISFSNDGAFCAVMYQTYFQQIDVNHVEIFSTSKLIGEKGINMDEEKDVRTKQSKFKRYLVKNIIKRYDMNNLPRLLTPTIIGEHAAFVHKVNSNIDFDYRTRTYWRTSEARRLFLQNMSYNGITEQLFSFLFYTIYSHFYIEDDYHGSTSVYDQLKYNDTRPYIVISNETGEYLVAFYNTYIDYRKYGLTYAIIDNSDYGIMPKSYLKEIEYNQVELAK